MTALEAVENTTNTEQTTSPETVIVSSPETETPEATSTPDPRDEELAALKRDFEETKRKLADSETRYQSLQTEKTTSDNRLVGEVANRFAAQETAIEARLNHAKTGLAASKAEMVRAMAEGRGEDVANLAEAIADHKTALKAAEWDHGNIQILKQREAEAFKARQEQPKRDPVEQFLSMIPGEPSRQWLRSHPELLNKVASSTQDAKKLFAYAQLAESEGNVADTPAYFDFVEEKLGMKAQTQAPKEQRVNTSGRTAQAAPSTNTAPSEPVSRSIKLDDVVRKLTPSDRANARVSFPDKTEDEALKLYAHGLVISKQRDRTFRPDFRL